MQDYNGLRFGKSDFVTGRPGIKIVIVKTLWVLKQLFCLWSLYFLAFITFRDFYSSCFNIIKQAHSKFLIILKKIQFLSQDSVPLTHSSHRATRTMMNRRIPKQATNAFGWGWPVWECVQKFNPPFISFLNLILFPQNSGIFPPWEQKTHDVR